MSLLQTNKEMLYQLSAFTDLIEGYQFSAHLSILSGNTIGKHLRHIIEFYQHLLQSYLSNQIVVNYDARPRNHLIETDKNYAKQQIEQLVVLLEQTNQDKGMMLCFSLNEKGDTQHIPTTFYRELAYNLEHAIHHLAIVKMAVIQHFPEIQLDTNFGIAYATIQYHNEKLKTEPS